MQIDHTFKQLIQALPALSDIRAIGKTGGATLPNDGFSDIDLFIFCNQIPNLEERNRMLAPLAPDIIVSGFGDHEHPHWGLVDSLLIGAQEVYLMFFTQNAFEASVLAILRGERTEREANYFYPTGRIASILGMHAFYDPDGFLARLKAMCAEYPAELCRAIIDNHAGKIDDHEDFQRAIRRADVLFYHATLDLALDHFLQTLFALNGVNFPSRKRSVEYIRDFAVKPNDCEEILQRVIELGSRGETLSESYALWHGLCLELNHLVSTQV